MMIYGHLRETHSQAQAKTVDFSSHKQASKQNLKDA